MIGRLLARIKKRFREKYVYDECADVRRCHEKYGILASSKPSRLSDRLMGERLRFLREELEELEAAHRKGSLPDQLDALLDLVYVAKGTAVMMGLDGEIWEDGWLEVQRSNMEKVRGVGKRGNPVDLVKPAGWEPPLLALVLACHGHQYYWEAPVVDYPPEVLEACKPALKAVSP